jgi:hypothetical protein
VARELGKEPERVGLVDERDNNRQASLAVATVPRQQIAEVQAASEVVRETVEALFKGSTVVEAAPQALATVAPVAGRVEGLVAAAEEVVVVVVVVAEGGEVEVGAEAGGADKQGLSVGFQVSGCS